MTAAKWEVIYRQAIRTLPELNAFFQTHLAQLDYPLFIPRPYAEYLRTLGPQSPVWREFIPTAHENANLANTWGLCDPIGDQSHLAAPQLIHRYQNRVLFLPASSCPIICRYCFRKNELTPPYLLFRPNFPQTMDYLQQHSQIEEIIFSGGDPFILSNRKINFYLQQFALLPHIRFLRFHVRTPIVLPERIDTPLLELLANFAHHFQKISIVIHINHPDELALASKAALEKLAASKLQLLAQSVLLKNVNDDPQILAKLYHQLLDLNIRPFYLHHPDQALGTKHFSLPLAVGKKIYQQLRQLLPGWALPQYVRERPLGQGKIPV